MSDRVLISRDGAVAIVRMNRPDKLNALDLGMFRGLLAAADEVEKDKSVRAVVLAGEGRAFCAGLDFMSFMAMSDGRRSGPGLLEPVAGHLGNLAQQAALRWYELSVPVVAAVQGAAFGGGLQIALGADIRVVSPDAQLSVMEIKWGLVPDMSGTQMLRRLVRLDVAKELTFTGRIVSGREAVELGLATRVEEDPFLAALALAQGIASRSPDAIRKGKTLLNESALLNLEAGLKLEETLQVSLIGSPNQLEAVQANLERRPPMFKDPA